MHRVDGGSNGKPNKDDRWLAPLIEMAAKTQQRVGSGCQDQFGCGWNYSHSSSSTLDGRGSNIVLKVVTVLFWHFEEEPKKGIFILGYHRTLYDSVAYEG